MPVLLLFLPILQVIWPSLKHDPFDEEFSIISDHGSATRLGSSSIKGSSEAPSAGKYRDHLRDNYVYQFVAASQVVVTERIQVGRYLMDFVNRPFSVSRPNMQPLPSSLPPLIIYNYKYISRP